MGKGELEEMLTRGRQLAQQGRWDEAVNILEEVISLDDRYMDAWLEKGKLLSRLGRIEEALEVFETMIGFAPDEADWWYHKGLCLTKLGRNEEALQAFREASRLNPEAGPGYQKEAASLLRMTGPEEDVIGELERAAQFQAGSFYTSRKFGYRVNLEYTWNDGTAEILQAREESDESVIVVSRRCPDCSLVIDAGERIRCNYPPRELVSDLAADLVTAEGKSWFYVFPCGQVPACAVRNPEGDGTEIWYELIATDRCVYRLKRITAPGDDVAREFAEGIPRNFELIMH